MGGNNSAHRGLEIDLHLQRSRVKRTTGDLRQLCTFSEHCYRSDLDLRHAEKRTARVGHPPGEVLHSAVRSETAAQGHTPRFIGCARLGWQRLQRRQWTPPNVSWLPQRTELPTQTSPKFGKNINDH